MLKNQLDKFSKKRRKRWWLRLTIFFLILILAFVALTFGLQSAYANKFYPGVKIGYFDVGNFTKDQVLAQLKTIEKNVQNKGLKFISGEKEVIVNPIVISATDPDLAKPILTFDWQQTLDQAYQIGRGRNWFQNLGVQLKTITFGTKASIFYLLDQEELLTVLKTSFSELEKPPANAQLEIKDGEFEITGEKSGYVFDYQKAIAELITNIEALNFREINLELEFIEQEIQKKLGVKS